MCVFLEQLFGFCSCDQTSLSMGGLLGEVNESGGGGDGKGRKRNLLMDAGDCLAGMHPGQAEFTVCVSACVSIRL